MTWILIVLAALVIFLVLVIVLKLPRMGWELTGVALCVGIAGYALQGHPGQAGAPKVAVENEKTADAALIRQRQEMGEAFGKGQNWLVLADGLARNGQYGAAAQVLGKAVRANPDDADLWIALGNALVGHGDGMINPAAEFAFRKAAAVSPNHPGPLFFRGLALAQSGRLPEARAVWAELLQRSPANAPWRGDLEKELVRIDRMIARANGQAEVTTGMPAAPAGAPAATRSEGR